ncbi:hypothetical protein Efla_000041 [Eimeria flavescens]
MSCGADGCSSPRDHHSPRSSQISFIRRHGLTTFKRKMETRRNADAPGQRCSCEICLLHPHLREALRRMQPPELRLYSHAELMDLLREDIASAEESGKQLVGSDESWWHLCSADKTFPLYCVPTREFVHSLAAYLASRVRRIWNEQRTGRECCRPERDHPTCHTSHSNCCSRWTSPQSVRILECGAGTGLFAAHLLPLLHQLLGFDGERWPSRDSHSQQEESQQLSSGHSEGQGGPLEIDSQGVKWLQSRGEFRAGVMSSCEDRAAADIFDAARTDKAIECQTPRFRYVASEPRQQLRLETWGLRCADVDMLPLGVDYENPQEPSLLPSLPPAEPQHIESSGSSVRKEKRQMHDSCKKRRKADAAEGTAGAQWPLRNSFTSISPELGAGAPHAAKDASEDTDQEAAESFEEAQELGGMQLMPLEDRPYFRDRFCRVPPLPGCEREEANWRLREDREFLRLLQNAPQLSRFDSLHSLLKGCSSVSQVVIFRRFPNVEGHS